MPQSGLTSRDRSRVRRSRTVRAETIVPLISPVSFVCIVPLHQLSSLPFSPHYEGNISRCTLLKLDRFHDEWLRGGGREKGGAREGRGKQDQEERASRSRLNVPASPWTVKGTRKMASGRFPGHALVETVEYQVSLPLPRLRSSTRSIRCRDVSTRTTGSAAEKTTGTVCSLRPLGHEANPRCGTSKCSQSRPPTILRLF